MHKPKVIAVVGPTASGKSALGVYLAQKLGGEVISADSRQVYKGLDTGTGKLTKKEMRGVPHYLLSVASPKRRFSVDHFVKQSTRELRRIARRGKTPIVVGGTGLYADTLLGRMSYAAAAPDPMLRKKLEGRSPAQLLAQLRRLDPRRAATIEPYHARRIIRAIEVAKALGKNPPLRQEQPYDVLWLGLNPQNAAQRIAKRLKERLKAGMEAEARKLHRQGLSYKRMEELGLEYRYLAQLLQKKIGKKEFEAALGREIQRYAKRQIRWFKRNKDIHWVAGRTEAMRLSKKFLGGR